MSRPRRSSAGLLVGLLMSMVAASPLGAIVYEGDRSWAEGLLEQAGQELAQPIPIVSTSSASTLSGLIAAAHASTGSDVVIALGASRDEVAVVRRRDRTVLVRSLEPPTSTYALAIAASELVRLLESRGRAPQRAGVGWGVRLSGGAQLDASPGREGVLIVPALGIGFDVRRWIAPLEPGLMLSVRFPGARPSGGGDELDYRRFGVAFGIASSLLLDPIVLRASVAFDVSITQIRPAEEEPRIAGPDRAVFGIDGLAGLRIPLGAGFDLEAAGGITVVMNPAEFLVGEEVALVEGRTRIRATLALGWSTP